jgi:hypothetical protein
MRVFHRHGSRTNLVIAKIKDEASMWSIAEIVYALFTSLVLFFPIGMKMGGDLLFT